eukprot:4894884-Amphidinium_carterae.1
MRQWLGGARPMHSAARHHAPARRRALNESPPGIAPSGPLERRDTLLYLTCRQAQFKKLLTLTLLTLTTKVNDYRMRNEML